MRWEQVPLGEAGKARCPETPWSTSVVQPWALLFRSQDQTPDVFEDVFLPGQTRQPHQGLGRILVLLPRVSAVGRVRPARQACGKAPGQQLVWPTQTLSTSGELMGQWASLG